MLKRCFLLAISFFFLNGLAAAQVRPDKWEFSGFAGLGALAGADSFLTPLSDGSSNLVTLDSESGYLVGVRITQNLARHFGAELEYSYGNQPGALINLAPALRRLDLGQKIHTVSYNGLVYLTPRGSKIRPFGTAGVGISLFQLDSSTEAEGIMAGLDLRDRYKFAFTWGGGVKVYSGRQWGFRFDFRDNVTGVPDYGLPRIGQVTAGVPGPGFRPDGLAHRLQFSGGFIFSFSGR